MFNGGHEIDVLQQDRDISLMQRSNNYATFLEPPSKCSCVNYLDFAKKLARMRLVKHLMIPL